MFISWENAFVNGKDVKNETLEFAAAPIINSKIKTIVTGLPGSISNLFLEFPTDHNKELVASFLDSYVKQENISLNTNRIYLVALAYFARGVKNRWKLSLMLSDLKTYLASMKRIKKKTHTNHG